jgi:hypothetical protein
MMDLAQRVSDLAAQLADESERADRLEQQVSDLAALVAASLSLGGGGLRRDCATCRRRRPTADFVTKSRKVVDHCRDCRRAWQEQRSAPTLD